MARLIMTWLNPFLGPVAQNTSAQRQQAQDKARQIRRSQALQRNTAVPDEDLEQQVDGADQTRSVRDEPSPQRGQEPQPSSQDRESQIDVTA